MADSPLQPPPVPPAGTPAPRGEQAARLLEEALPPSAPAAGRAIPTVESLAPRFPDLEIQEVLGAGGMGVVYRARHRRLDRLVALKILPESLGRDPAFAERFAREARTLARLDHPHVVRVHDFGETGGLYYLVLEYVDGANLRQVMGAGHVSPAEALAIVPQICEALQYAHDQGVVHRDIKPENILLDRRGQVKIADFGLAKLVGRTDGRASLTGTGQVMGTVQYMAPEQYRTPQDVDHRADLFSLGVVFYEMLTGELPVGHFKAPSESGDLDTRVDRIVMRALERELALRYQRADEMQTDVSLVTQGREPAAPPVAGVPAAASPSAAPTHVVGGSPGRWAAVLSALAIPIGFGVLGLIHAFWGGVGRGTEDAFLREAWKGAGAGILFLAGTVLGMVAAFRGARGPEPRRIRRVGVTLACVNLAMLPVLALIVSDEVRGHSSWMSGEHPRWIGDARLPRSVRLPPGEDVRHILAGVEAAWLDYAARAARPGWAFEEALALYTRADAEAIRAMDPYAQAQQNGQRQLGLPALLFPPPALTDFQVIRVEPSPELPRVRVTVRRINHPLDDEWSFPMVQDPDGAWRFLMGKVTGTPGR